MNSILLRIPRQTGHCFQCKVDSKTNKHGIFTKAAEARKANEFLMTGAAGEDAEAQALAAA
jgi:hypothetical protein